MPIVIDEVVGTVEPETPQLGTETRPETPHREPDPNSVQPALVQVMWARLEQRLERLAAD